MHSSEKADWLGYRDLFFSTEMLATEQKFPQLGYWDENLQIWLGCHVREGRAELDSLGLFLGFPKSKLISFSCQIPFSFTATRKKNDNTFQCVIVLRTIFNAWMFASQLFNMVTRVKFPIRMDYKICPASSVTRLIWTSPGWNSCCSAVPCKQSYLSCLLYWQARDAAAKNCSISYDACTKLETSYKIFIVVCWAKGDSL